ncbi:MULTISPECIES: MerR family transcriptional regulator [Streptomyces]|uniref:MerR family transcriptional regulator n=1 Tax=Streptomyces flavovirens TaxID=52258 RepID=A0ABV8N4L4_9ACTN|nr:MerR family transcriptional regulator [Streptomyces sp. MBT51]MBK3596660.1 MerR family transcriptional regulator [Streptomyces sp. MBT51]
MRIGELARRSGVSVRALRYYEEQSLLDADRTPGGQRDYPDGAVDRVQLIQQLYAAGLSSRTIVELLPCVSTGTATQSMFDRLLTERDRIGVRMDELAQAKAKLDRVIEQVLAAGLTRDGVTGSAPVGS